MFKFINRRLSRQVAVWLFMTLVPLLTLVTFAVINNETVRMEEEVLLNGKIAAKAGARAYELALNEGIDTGQLTLTELLDPKYTQFQTKAEDPRFHTTYDWYTDKYVQRFEDDMLHSNPDFIYTTGMNVDGYVPTTHAEYSLTPNGDIAHDNAVARSKKKYSTPLHNAAAQSLAPVLVLPYLRDKVEDCWDVIVPIYVKGLHWGAFRVGITRASIKQHQKEAAKQLIIIFSAFIGFSVLMVFLVLRMNVQPLEHLIEVAELVSRGEMLDAPMTSKKINEIGRITKCLDRLRNSLVTAMKRLNEY